jgi:predicted lipoprotein with Yx(FWY)xxD motif
MKSVRRERRGLITASLVALAAAVVIGTPAVAGATTPTVLVTTNATFGPILTTGSGFALYTLDTDHNGQSTCHGGCAAVWPPLNVPAGTVPSGGPGVTGTVGDSLQTNGTYQVTYNGSPLYTFVNDTAPGQVTGNGVSGFYVATVAAATTTTTTTAPSPPAAGTIIILVGTASRCEEPRSLVGVGDRIDSRRRHLHHAGSARLHRYRGGREMAVPAGPPALGCRVSGHGGGLSPAAETGVVSRHPRATT